ncbi:MAG: hypothetical protein ACR2F6_04605 [Mycobacteriales bacterium]
MTTSATVDFYRYVNADWVESTELPDDEPRYGTFHELRDAAQAAAREILESDESRTAPAGSPARKIADLYAGFLDERAVEDRGRADIEAALAEVDAVRSMRELTALVGDRDRTGGSGVFRMIVGTDPEDPERYIVSLYQGGLSLPDHRHRVNRGLGIRAPAAS